MTKNLITKSNLQDKIVTYNFAKKISKKYKIKLNELKDEIESQNKTLSVLSKKFKINCKLKDLKKFKKFKTIVIIGMGGSILGTEAIYYFFKQKIKKKVYFFNDLNDDEISTFKKKNKKILFLIISKSGDTIETLSNTFTLNILKKNSKNIIIISEKKNNHLYYLSKKFNLFFIEHKNYIGGRYSVLSEVGLIPSYLMGINITKLRSKILSCLKEKYLKKNSLILANLINSKKMNNLIFLNYSPKLEKFLFWCQQLIAESLGKKGKGFLPIISNVPKDHHSLLQLYLDGPKDKLFQIFSVEDKKKNIIKLKGIFKKNNFLNNQSLKKIKNAQKNALIKAFKKNKIPFREFKIKKINEETLGLLFSYFILETVLIGKLVNINPFNQPAVEQVKRFTKEYLN